MPRLNRHSMRPRLTGIQGWPNSLFGRLSGYRAAPNQLRHECVTTCDRGSERNHVLTYRNLDYINYVIVGTTNEMNFNFSIPNGRTYLTKISFQVFLDPKFSVPILSTLIFVIVSKKILFRDGSIFIIILCKQ